MSAIGFSTVPADSRDGRYWRMSVTLDGVCRSNLPPPRGAPPAAAMALIERLGKCEMAKSE